MIMSLLRPLLYCFLYASKHSLRSLHLLLRLLLSGKLYAILSLIMCSFTSAIAHAYTPSLSFDHKYYKSFQSTSYAYSSLFRSGRDNFHWLDISYGGGEYSLDNEIGRVNTYGSSYRFAHRQRWHRFFKPAIFVGAGVYHRTFTDRQQIAQNIIQGDLDNRVSNDLVLLAGGGYLWEIKSFLIGFSISYGYDFGYAGGFYSPAIFFSYKL